MQSLKIAVITGHSALTAGKRTPPFVRPIDIDKDGKADILSGGQYREHFANVGVAVRLDAALQRCGFNTFKVAWNDGIAEDDTTPDNSAGLALRQQLVKNAKCDLSIAIHFNAFGNGITFNTAKGVCTYLHSTPSKCGDSMALAKRVQENLILGTKQDNRGVHCDAFAEVNCLAMGTKASVLVELAFMTNQYEAESLMANSDFWTEAAEEICKGVCEYTRTPYVAPEEDSMVTKVITVDMNGKDVKLTSVLINGENYVKIRDLANAQSDDAFTVDWDALAGKVIIKSK